MNIPYEQLSQVALDGVLDDYVLREGTDYGDFAEGRSEHSLKTKRETVLRALADGTAELWFDPETASTTLRMVE